MTDSNPTKQGRKMRLTLVMSEGLLAVPLEEGDFIADASVGEDEFIRRSARMVLEFCKNTVESTDRELSETYGENWKELDN